MSNEGKIAIVTGGSRGLGKQAAMSLALRGIDVIITYHTKKEEAEAVVRHIEKGGRKAAALQLDAGRTEGFADFEQRLLALLEKKWGARQFQFLVNNAGFGLNSPLLETTEEQFDDMINVHFKGVFFLSQRLISHMADHGGIVNVSTGLTRFTMPGNAAYAGAKAAVEVLGKYMAKEWGARGIRVNTVAPGPVLTDFNDGRIRDNEAVKNHLGSLTALGRVGEAEDIGGVIASLCTGEMAWVNAQRIEVSGGLLL